MQSQYRALHYGASRGKMAAVTLNKVHEGEHILDLDHGKRSNYFTC